MRVLLLMVFMFSLSCWAADSNPPTPSAAQGQQNKGDGNQKPKAKQEPQSQQPPAVPVGITVIATGSNAPQPQGGEGKAPEWGAVIVASLALIVACGALFAAFRQMRLFQAQLGHMESALKDSGNMAHAARNQSESIMHAERAYVKLGHVKPGLKKIEGESSVVSVKARNMGRTPAQVTDIHIDFALLDYGTPLPKPYPFRPMKRESFPNGILMPNEWLNHAIHVKTKEALIPGKQLWFFGEVDYIDVFGRRWRGGYARKYWDHKDDNLYNNTEDRDNFDRERPPDEGRDWDEKSKAIYYARKKAESTGAA